MVQLRKTKTRVAQDVGTPGKWVAQYWDAEMRLWFDIGDARDTPEEARAHLAARLAEEIPPKHDYEPGEGQPHPMSADPPCRICGASKRATAHA